MKSTDGANPINRSSRRHLVSSGRRTVIEMGPVRFESGHELVCAFPSLVHPRTAQAHERTLRWLREHDLLDPEDRSSRLATERYTWLAGRMFPEADEACFQLIADFTSWMFHHDDQCDEGDAFADPDAMEERFRWQIALLRGEFAASSGSPSARALEDVSRRFLDRSPDLLWHLRFVVSVQEYFDGCLWEARNRGLERPPPIREYTSLRPFAGAVWMYVDLIELVMGQSLPFELRKHRDVQRLRRIVADVVSWHNDLYSFRKEIDAGDHHNLVLVLRHEERVDLASGIAAAAQRTNERVTQFETLARTLPVFPEPLDEVLAVYLDALGCFMRGALDWAQEAERYRQPPAGGTGEGATSRRV